MRKSLWLLALLALVAAPVAAQTLASGTISTAGANCSVATRCIDADVRGFPSVGIAIDVGTSGTFAIEVSLDASSAATGTWYSYPDSAGDSSLTADGIVFVANPGYRRLRLRASAISGAATVRIEQGVTAPSSVDLSGASLTASVDAPANNPLFMRLSNGSIAVDTIPVSLASVPTHAVTQSGTWNIGAISSALPAGANLIGTTALGATAAVTNSAAPFYLTSAGTTNATNIKNGPGNIYNYHLVNTTGTLYFLRMYNLASSPTCSSATGFVKTIPIPASTTGSGIVIPIEVGEGYSVGISFCLTLNGANNDNNAAATGVYINIDYK